MRPVVVLSPTLSGNAAGRALVFVDLLAGYRDVVLAGFTSGSLWRPLTARTDVEIVDLGRRGFRPPGRLVGLLRERTSILVKPLFSSFGQWLMAARPSAAVLDIDDPELALTRMDVKTIVRSLPSLDGILVTSILLRLVGKADAITVSNNTLSEHDDAFVIPHARDARLFPGDGGDGRRRAREALGIARGERLVAFVGTARAHKGVDLLVRAASLLAPALVVIVGADRPSAHPANVRFVPPVPYAEGITWLTAADVVVVPQRGGAIGRRQAPAKVVDALAAGRAIVASDLPPIREMVGDAAVLVAPDSVNALATAIKGLLADDAQRRALEDMARHRFAARYSLDAVRPTLDRALATAEAGCIG